VGEAEDEDEEDREEEETPVGEAEEETEAVGIETSLDSPASTVEAKATSLPTARVPGSPEERDETRGTGMVEEHQKRWQASYFVIICAYPVNNDKTTSLYNVGQNFI
jgi:hypothetical protein